MQITKEDIKILRELGKQKMEIAQGLIQQENITLWTGTNDLKMTKPPVFINEVPWHEMNVEDELTLRAQNPFCKQLELELRKELYTWKHMPGSMVINPYIECPLVVHDSDIGMEENVDTVKTDATSDVVSRHFNIQIQEEEDIEKIKDPIITLDQVQTNENFKLMKEIFGESIEIKLVGTKGLWFTPWDNLIRLTGITEAMMDLILRPEYVDKLVARYVDTSIVRLEKYKELGIWASNNNNTRVGSGGYGYCTELEPTEKHSTHAPTSELWGCGNAQIFSEVSPTMHWEFSLKHELRWMKHFGLTYYGCCEPLHNKLDILERIPNLRKISMSPWAKLEQVQEFAKDRYVLSCKPSPAIFAEERWRPEQAKKDIMQILEKTKGCSIELIMKDVSTVKYKPERLWEWNKIAQETIDDFYC